MVIPLGKTISLQVQTVTRRELERRLRRQVVLADGRVIEEGDPEVTVDAVEDEQTHEDGGREEDRMRVEFGEGDRKWEMSTGEGERKMHPVMYVYFGRV